MRWLLTFSAVVSLHFCHAQQPGRYVQATGFVGNVMMIDSSGGFGIEWISDVGLYNRTKGYIIPKSDTLFFHTTHGGLLVPTEGENVTVDTFLVVGDTLLRYNTPTELTAELGWEDHKSGFIRWHQGQSCPMWYRRPINAKHLVCNHGKMYYKDSLFTGHAFKLDSVKQLYSEVRYKRGERMGFYTAIKLDSNLIVGRYTSECRAYQLGSDVYDCTTYYPNGNVEYQGYRWTDHCSTHFSDIFGRQAPDGAHVWAHSNGQLKLGLTYLDGHLEGDLIAWNRSGQRLLVAHHEDGAPVGTWTCEHPDGTIKFKLTFTGDKIKGWVELPNVKFTDQGSLATFYNQKLSGYLILNLAREMLEENP